jgi:hypothetical protein
MADQSGVLPGGLIYRIPAAMRLRERNNTSAERSRRVVVVVVGKTITRSGDGLITRRIAKIAG